MPQAHVDAVIAGSVNVTLGASVVLNAWVPVGNTKMRAAVVPQSE